MSITRRFFASFEERNDTYSGGTHTAQAQITTSPALSDEAALGVTTLGTQRVFWDMTSTTQARALVHFRPHRNGVSSGSPDVFGFFDTTTRGIVVRINTANQLSVYAGATLLASAADVLRPQRWVSLALDVKIHATTGWATLWLNGQAIVSYTGQTNQGVSAITRLYIGTDSASGDWAGGPHWDDIHCDDTAGEGAPALPADLRFWLGRANGNGYSSQFVGSDADSVNNSLLVDEQTVNTSDYVESTTSGHRDGYTKGTIEIVPRATVHAAIPTAVAINPSGGANQLILLTRLGGVNLESAGKALTSSYARYIERQTAKPGGGAWAASDIASAEVGIGVA